MAGRLITSSENQLFKKLKKLQQKKYREKEGAFIAEGRKIIESRSDSLAIFVNQDREEELSPALKEMEYYLLPKQLFNELSTQENSQGVIAIFPIPEPAVIKSADIIALDKIQDPGNMGTIIRTADAAGYKDIILIEGCVDIYNEKCVRSSMGSIFSLNFLFMNQQEFLDYIKAEKYKLITTALEDDSIDYRKLKVSNKNCIVFGNEGNGVSPEILNQSSEKVIIPIYGSAESLNVSIAAGILMYKIIELKE